MIEFLTLSSLTHLDRLSREPSFRKSTGMLQLATVGVVSNILFGWFQKLIRFLYIRKSGFFSKRPNTCILFQNTSVWRSINLYIPKKNEKQNLKIVIT